MSSLDDAAKKMIENLKTKTGKTLAEWTKIGQRSGCAKHGEIVKHLKSEHGLTHGYANMIAHEVLQSSAQNAPAEDLIEQQYGGSKAALRPTYDKLLKAVQKLGKDIEIAPKKAYVSLRRNKQFAIIQPSTATRLDIGINLKGVEPGDRLESSGSFNAMVTHRVRITSASEIDKELISWLQQAYDQS
jgi:predicted transport protein